MTVNTAAADWPADDAPSIASQLAGLRRPGVEPQVTYDRRPAISPFTDPASCCDVDGPATGHRRVELGRIEEVVGR